MVSEERFPHADERIARNIVAALQELSLTPSTHVVIVTRGHALDEEALHAVIGSPAGYVGMIGSRRKVRAVYDRLRAKGVEASALERVRAPIGLNIGAETPAEIAVSVLAEIIVLRSAKGGDGRPMRLEQFS
jgi:xanthine dehydrogenase accessory factor